MIETGYTVNFFFLKSAFPAFQIERFPRAGPSLDALIPTISFCCSSRVKEPLQTQQHLLGSKIILPTAKKNNDNVL